ncbi:unnamed protein product [Diamesa serratosioi]
MVRNCYIPGCDALCRTSVLLQKRKMFMAKQGTQLDDWKKVLDKYGNRLFKIHDRICERHFKDEDINSFWETVIKGEVHKTTRDRARLNDNAIPSLNLDGGDAKKKKTNITIDNEANKVGNSDLLVETIKRPSRKRKAKDDKEVSVIEQPIVIVVKPDKFENTDEHVGTIQTTPERDGLITPIEVESPADSNENGSPENIIKIITEADKNEMIENLDILWDEAFDTTLPSQLWGIQRCPERTFIVFSKFNKSIMKSSKLLYVDNEFQYKIFVDDKEILVKPLEKHEINTEFFSNLLSDLDEDRIP